MNKCSKYLASLIAIWLTTFSAIANNSYRLTEFYSGDSTLRLQGTLASQTLSIPLSGAKKIDSAVIHIESKSSKALIEKRSILNVRFNNATIAQFPYSANKSTLIENIDVPSQLWREGFNTLTFEVTQHYAEMCEDGAAPELWSEIDLYRSNLVVNSSSQITKPSLKHLSNFFSPGIGSQNEVIISTIENTNSKTIEQVLPIVAQALALRNEYKPLLIETKSIVTPELPTLPNKSSWNKELETQYLTSPFYINKQNENNISVLVGEKDEISAYIPSEIVKEITGAYIGIQRTNAVVVDKQIIVPSAIRLIISGNNQQELSLAATTLATMDDSINPDPSIVILEQTPITTKEFVSTNILQADAEHTFADSGASSAFFNGQGEYYKQVDLSFPADFYTPESATVHLNLDFAYGAGFGDGSIMNVLVNGKLVHGLTLNNPNGQAFEDYRLDLPARYFQAGSNKIDFLVSIKNPQTATGCNEVRNNFLMFQLHASSSIDIPYAGSVATLPDLALFSDTSYPFTQASAEVPAIIYYTQEAMLASALNIVAKTAQVAGTLLPSLNVHNGVPAKLAPFAMVLTTPSDMNEKLYEEYDVALSATKKWSYKLQNTLQNKVEAAIDNNTDSLMIVNGVTVQKSSLGELGVLIMKENPSSEDTGSVLILTAETVPLISDRVKDLVDLNLWGQLSGDFFIWENNKKPELTMRVSPKFEVGEPASWWMEYRMWLSNNPIYWIVGILVLVIFCALICVIALRRRNKSITESWE